MNIKKSFLALLLSISVLITSACSNTASEQNPQNPNTEITNQNNISSDNNSEENNIIASGFYVSGTSLYDANGNKFIMRGINHPHSWFKDKLETAVPAIAATGANTIRVVLSDGQQYTKDLLDDINKIIDICKENKLICILEVHDITGKDEIEGIRKTAEYWVEMKSALIGNESYVLLNIANEWIGNWDLSETWYQGYSEAIQTIRNAGIENTLIIDTAGWGQLATPIKTYGKTLLDEDPNKNLVFSIHMYGTAGKNSRVISSNIECGTKNELCVIIGEFGYNHSDGDVDEEYIMKYCTENDIGYLGWSWKGNGGGVEYLDIALDWDGNTLSEDWGEKLINGENGIKKTSEICSVFDK